MTFKSNFWQNWSAEDFAQLIRSDLLPSTVAVLPIAATEQHGPHMPVSVDATIVQALVEAAAKQLHEDAVLFLPTQQIGFSPEHESFAGTLSLGADTLLSLLGDIAQGVARTGIRKLLILNSHGGQHAFLDIAARQMRQRHGLTVWGCSWYQLPIQPVLNANFDAHEQRFGVHAGAIETALMLALQPQWVHMELARNFKSSTEARVAQYPTLAASGATKLGWMMDDLNPYGAAGNARSATAAQGQAVFEAATNALVQLLREAIQMPALPTTNPLHSDQGFGL